MSKKYLFDIFDIMPDNIEYDMIKTAPVEINIENVISTVTETIHKQDEPAKKKMSKGKRITLTLIAAVLFVGLILSALGMAELLFNMEEPITQEMRNEVLNEYHVKENDFRIAELTYKMEHPEEISKYDSQLENSAEYKSNEYKLNKVLDILKNNGYDISSLKKEKLIAGDYILSEKFDIKNYCDYLDICCNAIKDRNIKTKDKVHIELQLERSLSGLLHYYILASDTDRNKLMSLLINSSGVNFKDAMSSNGLQLSENDKKNLDLVTAERDKILDIIADKAFEVDIRDQKAVEDYKNKLNNEYLNSIEFDMSDIWVRLLFMIRASDIKKNDDFFQSEEYKMFSDKLNAYYTSVDNCKDIIIKDIENETGEPYNENNLYNKMIRLEWYVECKQTLMAEKEYCDKTIELLKKYGYNTDITYNDISYSEKVYAPEYYENHYKLLMQVCDMVDKRNKEMTLDEKSDIYIFLVAAGEYQKIDTTLLKAYPQVLQQELDKKYDDMKISRRKRSKDPEYNAKIEENNKLPLSVSKKHNDMYTNAVSYATKAMAQLNFEYYSRLNDFANS